MSRQDQLIGPEKSLKRLFALASVIFLVLTISIIFLFGHLMARSLSRKYLEDTLITGRQEDSQPPEILQEPENYSVTETRRELEGRTLQGSPQREVFESVSVSDSEGNVVYSEDLRSVAEVPEERLFHLDMDEAFSDQAMVETENNFSINVPLGEVGDVVGSMSKLRLADRVGQLRRDLMWQTAVVAAAALLILGVAFFIVWQMIKRTRRALLKRREAEQLAALGALAANLAHEIRNPLNSINLNLELLDEDLEEAAPAAQESLRSTRQEVGRLAQLVSDFLNYARPTPPALDELKVKTLVEEVIAFIKPEVRSMGVHLRPSAEMADVRVKADASQLRQVLINLVLNAAQAVAKLAPDRRVVEVRLRNGQSEAQLVVHDRGDGISEEHLDKVRTAFFTRRRGGSGLGLAIADRIVLAHQGRLELHNLSEGGFEAQVFLPLSGNGGNMSA